MIRNDSSEVKEDVEKKEVQVLWSPFVKSGALLSCNKISTMTTRYTHDSIMRSK